MNIINQMQFRKKASLKLFCVIDLQISWDFFCKLFVCKLNLIPYAIKPKKGEKNVKLQKVFF